MKNLILGMLLFLATAATAQKSLFENISTTDQYEYYSSVWDEENDGTYAIKDAGVATFETKTLPTGEGYSIKASAKRKDQDDYRLKYTDAVEQHYTCVGYPYESLIKDKREKTAIVAIGEYVFIVRDVSEDGTSFDGIDYVFIKTKESTTTSSSEEKAEPKKKKKLSFKDIANAVKDNYTGGSSSPSYGAAHKELQSKNLDKLITDYLVTMKAKQDARSSAQKQHDKNVTDAKTLYNSDVNAYNDKIKASPEYKKMKEHQKRMAEMENGTNAQSVTIYNKTTKDIYIYADGNRNGTRINVNSSTKVDCSSNYTYKFDSNSGGSGTAFYGANSSCGGSFTVR
jgi:hypothetical protein